mmetsp:Transcript_20215/g.65121  ORF Transcript_20215/g.65121 Transcript_20215/m.65121 type:complete len:265 (+) Transcript_20215:219-1013(+)
MEKRSHTKVLLSRAHVARREVSSRHHDADKMPCSWPRKVPRGMVVEERRSQRRTTAESSPEQVAMWRPSEGFQQTSATFSRPASRSSHQGLFCRRSQTTQVPLVLAVARMWLTCVFQATVVISPPTPLPLLLLLVEEGGAAGTKTFGFSGESNATTKTSPSAPPEATRWADDAWGLNSSPFTAPECRWTLLTKALGCPAANFAGSQTSTDPSLMPPAIKPIGKASDRCQLQVNDANRADDRPFARGFLSLRDSSSKECSSKDAP